MQSPGHHSRVGMPKRIILMRHGESKGNLDDSAYTTTPDYKIPLTHQGQAQAQLAGDRLRQVVSGTGSGSSDWRVYFYVSPYERTRSTLREIGRSFSKNRVIGVREECRIREQDFGNFQVEERMKVIKQIRERFGRFFYRFPEGESAADVYDRVSSKFPFFFLVILKVHRNWIQNADLNDNLAFEILCYSNQRLNLSCFVSSKRFKTCFALFFVC